MRTAHEINRILRPDGKFNLVDFGKPRTLGMTVISLVMRQFEETGEHFAGLRPAFLQQAEFTAISEQFQMATIFGPVSFYRAAK